jgi:RNAse (barnase) inhibitor barstar
MTTIMTASRQWSSRPDDQRFTSLPELHTAVSRSRKLSQGKVISSRQLRFQPIPGDERYGLQVVGQNGVPALPTHWSFGQIASLAKAPAGYLRTLPAPIAADNLNYGLQFARDIEDVGLLLTKVPAIEGGLPAGPGLDYGVEIRAATGPNYGRVWNSDIVRALMDRFGDGVTGDFKVPGEFGRDVPITKANTTIYGSDRDMFVFLADEKNRLQVRDRRDGKAGGLARGFFVWNSEVGSNTFGAAFFLFDYVCQNRIVWGAQQYKEIRIRHTASAPDRWLDEVQPVLIEYANSAAKPIEDTIRAAQARKIDDLDKFLANRFTAAQASSFKRAHEAEEGRPMETLWDVVTGITAKAKDIKWQDQRVELEAKAGKILDLVAA